MKKKIFTIVVFALTQILVSQHANAQLSMELQGSEVIIPTSQTYDFIKQGTIGASLYTGTINYSLPIYTYKDKDFEIPISFDYASNGYKPNSRAAELGLGWTLNAGGCITRDVKGIPDEKTEPVISPFGTGVNIKGFLHLNGSSFNDWESNPKIMSDLSRNIFLYRKDPSSPNSYETTPDIFHFNFMGHSGYFYVWYNGEFKIYSSNPNDNIKAEISFNNDNIQHITLTTQNGYKYCFGGETYDKEYAVYKDNSAIERSKVHTWKLYSIIAPNNRSVYFRYKNPNGYYGIMYNYQPYSTYLHNIFTAGVSSHDYMKNVQSSGMYSSPIEKIEISDGPVIDFSYIASSGELYSRYNSGGGTENAISTPKLHKIKVMSGTDTIARCNVAYKLSNPNMSSNPRLNNTIYFLGKVNIKGEGTYDFEYNSIFDRGFPALGSFSIDHWGYYNGSNDGLNPLNFIDYLTYSNDNTEIIGTDIRNSNSIYTKMGMLKQINYPFGGHSTIEYESHDYSNQVIRDSRNLFLPELSDIGAYSPIAGGVRIKNVETRNADNQVIDSKIYSYIRTDGHSSGILLSMPRYGIKYEASGYYGEKAVKYYSLYDLYSYNKTHIEYSRVIQTNNDGGKIIYSYTNYNDYPDLPIYNIYLSSEMRIPTIITTVEGTYAEDFYIIESPYVGRIRNILTPMSSMQNKRGKLKQTEIRTKDEDILQILSNQYSELKDFTYNTQSIVGEDYRITGSKHFCFWQTGTSTVNNYNSDNITTNISYNYNSYDLIASSTATNSKGDNEITRYEYATDYASSGGIYTTMVINHLLDYPVTVKNYYGSGSSETLISGKKYTYALFNNIIKPSSVESYNTTTGTWQLETIFNSYDTKGNLTQSTDANGIPTSYIWGYNGLYLVAKGQNVTYSTLSAQVGVSSAIKEGLTANHFTVSDNCPNAIIDFYEYIPFIGLSKYTDPSGKVLTYNYNNSGKLKAITDENGKLHNEYLYSPDNKK